MPRDAEIRDGASGDEAQLAEINENLMRANLSPAEQALHIGARKAICERLHPETKHGCTPGKPARRRDRTDRFSNFSRFSGRDLLIGIF